ncbi:MAG: hypothetical protein KDG56_18350, partial [Ottowia sp.]|nr:hypothetical protein [Ottowia sp.]
MSSAGLWMLATLAVLVIATGLPAWALLIGTSSLFGLAGVLTGQVDPALLGALPGRLVGLLENDLLHTLFPLTPLFPFPKIGRASCSRCAGSRGSCSAPPRPASMAPSANTA